MLYSSNKVLCEMRASSFANFSFKNPSLKNNPSYRLSFQSVGIQTTFIKSHERKWQKWQLHCSGSPELVYSMIMLFVPTQCFLAPWSKTYSPGLKYAIMSWRPFPALCKAGVCPFSQEVLLIQDKRRENRRRDFLDRGHWQQRAVPRFFIAICSYQRVAHTEGG